MDVYMMTNKRIGDLLIEAEIITTKTLERALARQQKDNRRIGVILEKMGVITDEELVEALAKQFDLKIVKGFADGVFPESLLSLIPVDLAVQKQVFPIRELNGILAVAVSDPFDIQTIDFLAQKTGRKILTAVATRMEISNAINRHYLHGAAASGNNKRVLVVEDSQPIARLVQTALEKEGYEVSVAHDGLTGLKLALMNKPDLVICDAIMPRMDGYTLLNNLRANPASAEIKVILLTSKATAEEEQKALRYGFYDFISKPVQTVRVISRVKRAFDQRNH
jgi:CheY-like chemotaxis protein